MIHIQNNVLNRTRLAMSTEGSSQVAAKRVAIMEERSRLACEIHDTLAQAFAGILLQLEAFPERGEVHWQLGSDPVERVARAKHLAKCGLEDSRRILLGLRPKSLDGVSFVGALKALAQCCSSEWNIICKVRFIGHAADLPADVQDQFYRIAQEALCNVRKHSGATSVSIRLRCESDMIALSIKDNGQGFEANRPKTDGGGFGLSSMRERARRIGGGLNIRSVPRGGTEVKVSLLLSGPGPKGIIPQTLSSVRSSPSFGSAARHGNRASPVRPVMSVA